MAFRFNKKAIITVLIMAGGAGLILWAAADAQWIETVSVDELVGGGAKYTTTVLQVFGKVQPGSIVHDGTVLRFAIAGKGAGIARVVYNGERSIAVNEGADVLIKGTYRDNVLDAQTVLTKCPSKYKSRDGGTK